MNAKFLAEQGYGNQAATTRTARGIEYEAFARATRNLKIAMDLGPKGFASLVAALHTNRRLWTILAADVAENGNGLPDDLRARIFYLAEFTGEHTRKVLRREESAEDLIEINTAIMRGLRAQAEVA